MPTAAEQAALNTELQITNQLQNTNNAEIAEGRDLANELRNAFRGIGAEITNLIKDEMKDFDGAAKDVAKTINKDINSAINKQKTSTTDITKILEKQRNGSLKIAEVEGKISAAKQRQLDIEDLLLEAVSEGIMSEEKRAEIVGETNDRFKAQNALLKEALVKAEQFEKKLGITYKIFEGIEKIPILNSLIKIEKVKDAMEEAAGKGKSVWGVFGTGISATFSQIGKSLKDPLVIATAVFGIFKKLYDITLEYDEALVKTGRTLNLNREQTEKLYDRSAAYAQTQHDSFVTTKRLLESQVQLNEALGTSVTFADESAKSFAKLTHYYGLTAEAAAKLEELGQEQKTTSETIKKTILATAGAQKLQYGGGIAYQKVLDKVANISSDIYIKFKGNVKAITEAVMQADRLGLSLEQVDQIGESLLNFESSIENELKAELLTGRAINLEKARSASLSGDTAKLTQEIVSQVGNIHEFEKMNVIQRKAYAEAFGMNVKDMSEMLRKQEFQAALGDKVKASAEEQLKFAQENGIAMSEAIQQELERKSLADEQKEIMDKLKDVLMKITSGPMKTFAHMMEKVLGYVVGIIEGFGKMTGGGLGKALGAGLLAAPLLIGAVKLAMGASKALFFNGMSPSTAPWMRIAPGGMALSAGQPFVQGKGPLAPTMGGPIQTSTLGKGIMGKMGGRMGMGVGLGLAGMGLNAIAGNMDEGGSKTAISALGGAASGAAMGAMFGPIGMGIGAAAGALWSLYGSYQESEAKREAKEAEDKAKREAADAKTKEMVEALTSRPIHLNVGGKTILEYNNASTMYGTDSNILAK
jgi:hypothetical protein